ncbi:hypothetical protein BIZ37_22540 [Photobacterium sp. BZF1]|uniref:hypothetical protein n=1 Tax=Photobacterium sp. BZF1 TaxID=1904457 RepID=UPI001653A81D|nr:hypothetical protein [Photobacterium sp. BZF1]MBC7005352.1 hypothetical protein [Photobacterium sp. BZF1]
MYIMSSMSEASSNGINGTLQLMKLEAQEWKLQAEELKVSLKVAECKVAQSTSLYKRAKSIEGLQGIKNATLEHERLEAQLKYALSKLTTTRAQITFLKKAANI